MNCIQGSATNDTLVGNNGANCINAKGGNDRIIGGGGNDTLIGNSGADRFVFNNITQVKYLFGNRYLVKSADGNDIIQDFSAIAGDLILNRKNNTTVVYNLGSVTGNPGGGSTPGGNGTSLGSPSFDLSPIQPLIDGTTPFGIIGGSNQLGISEGTPIILDSQENPQLPFFIKNRLKTFEGNQVGVFEITPTSRYRFENEVVVVSPTQAEELKSVPITSNTQHPNFKQVIIVLQDAEAPANSLYNGTQNNDILTGSNSGDLISGLAGNDTLRGVNGDDIIVGWAGADRLIGGDGADSVYGNSGNDQIFGSIGEDKLNGGAGHDTVRGGGHDDVLFGWTGHDKLFGDAGDDFLDGELGNDTLQAGSGNDTLQGGAGNDRIVGGEDTDLLIEKGIGFKLTNTRLIGLGIDTLSGIENVHLIGLETDDRLNASQFNHGSVTLEGGEGADTLIGGEKDDQLEGGSGADRLIGKDHNDQLEGEAGNDLLSGGLGHDVLLGTKAGSGKGEIDTLYGGMGSDVFILGNQFQNSYDDQLTTISEGVDDYALIQDFRADMDTIQLKGSETYFIENISLDGVNGAGIYEGKGTVIDLEGNVSINRELIGLVAGVNAFSLSVTVGQHISWIGSPLV